MNKSANKIIIFIFLVLNIFRTTSAEILYENNFDDGSTPKYFTITANAIEDGQPIWTLTPSFINEYGPENHFYLSDTSSHSSPYSLKFTYEASNNICNTCGNGGSIAASGVPVHIKTGHDGANYFISDAGEDLTIADNPVTTKMDDGPKAIPGRFLYNRNGGLSLWKIKSITNENGINDRLNLELISPGKNGETTINGGDSILLSRTCGVDGLIGIVNGENDITRRSDCNSVIVWFANVTPQLPGASIFRRSYLKAEITSPTIHQKLHYHNPDRNGANQGSILLFADSNVNTAPDTHLQLTGMRAYGGENIYRPGLDNGFENMIIQRGIWYYIEEEYHAATQDFTTDPTGNTYNNDGSYRLWFSKATEDSTMNELSPSFEITNLPLPPITGGSGTHISFWGNLQHKSHARGSWYIDDVIISNDWNGPVPFDGINTSPPKSPTLTN